VIFIDIGVVKQMQINKLVINRLRNVSFGVLAIAFAFAMQIVLAPHAHATTYNLSPTPALGECNIYDAIDAINTSAISGGCEAGTGSNTINLSAGTYTFITTPNPVTFNGDLTINGAGATSTIIDGNSFSGLNYSPTNSNYTLTLSNLTMQNFTTSPATGVAIASFNGNLVASHLLIHDNTCTDEALPICALFVNDAEGTTQSVTFRDSAVYSNSATGLISAGNTNGSALNMNIINNTFYGNDGIILAFFNAVEGSTNTVNFVNNTVSHNNFPFEAGWLSLNFGAEVDTGISNVNVKNNIFDSNASGSTPNNCGPNSSTNGHVFTDGGNVSSDDTCNTFFTGTNDKNSTDPQLAAPAMINNTYILALNSGSPALDNGISGGLTPDNDQRGVTRPQGSSPDSGAYELEVATPGLPNTGNSALANMSSILGALAVGLIAFGGTVLARKSFKRK